MLYLLDANILIDANQYYYPIERIPEFWEWLVEKGTTGVLKVPQEIYDEIGYPSQSNRLRAGRHYHAMRRIQRALQANANTGEPACPRRMRSVRPALHQHILADTQHGL